MCSTEKEEGKEHTRYVGAQPTAVNSMMEQVMLGFPRPSLHNLIYKLTLLEHS